MTTRSSAVYEFYVHIDWIKKKLLDENLPIPKKLVYDMAKSELDLNMSYQSFLTLSKKFLAADGPSLPNSVKKLKETKEKRIKQIPLYKHDEKLEAQSKLFHTIRAIQEDFEGISYENISQRTKLCKALYDKNISSFQNENGHFYDLREVSFSDWLERKFKKDNKI